MLRKSLKAEGSSPSEEAAARLTFPAIRNFEEGGRAVRGWAAARDRLALMCAGRFDA